MSFDFQDEPPLISSYGGHRRREAAMRAGFGVPSLVCAILALVIAMIPCMGLVALPIAILAFVLALFSMGTHSTGSGIAGFVISLIAGGVWALMTFIVFGGQFREAQHRMNQRENEKQQQIKKNMTPPLPE